MNRLTVALQRLAIARSVQVDAATLVVYTEELEDLDLAHLEAACRTLGRSPRREFEPAMPEVGAIRHEAIALEREARTAALSTLRLKAPAGYEPTYVCHLCRDEPSGWRLFQCPETRCGWPKDHAPHSYVERCQCWPNRPKTQVQRATYDRAEAEHPRGRR